MFENLGFSELVVILIVALVVLGPERLPDVARKAGLWYGKIRRFVSSVQSDINKEIAESELKRIIQEQVDRAGVHEIIEETKQTIAKAEQQYLVSAITEPPPVDTLPPASIAQTTAEKSVAPENVPIVNTSAHVETKSS